MPIRSATVEWTGGPKDGGGIVRVGSGLVEARYSVPSRFENAPGTNPEELLGAAHAACFTMAFAIGLAQKGHAPRGIRTSADVAIERAAPGYRITGIVLKTEADVPGLDEAAIQEIARDAAANCPVSQALTGTEIDLEARKAG